MSIRIDGLSELSDRLKLESARTAKRYLLNCAKPAAQVVIEAMQATVPEETMRLEEGLTYQTRFENGEQTTLRVMIGPARNTFWGMFQEFGTYAQAGRHWMARAFASCQDKVLSVFATELLARLADMEAKDK